MSWEYDVDHPDAPGLFEASGAESSWSAGDGPKRLRRGPSGSLLRLVALVLTALLIAGIVGIVLLDTKVREGERRDRDRASAQAVAEQFALRMDTFDGAELTSYAKGVNELLTTKAKTDFAKQFESFEQIYSQGKATGKGEVLITAVGDLDQDSATVLVVHDATLTSTFGGAERHFRWSVNLNKIDGSWLVDDFTPVG